jgi:glycosyltransferase involved in cell wall biosynthesis
MNEHKIAFIYCYNDDRLLEESILYIQSLNIPHGYQIEILPVKDAFSMSSGYNFAMKNTDAKFKVYLHQDVFIINRDFIKEVLSIFHKNSDIGIIGLTGAKSLPANGIWLDSQQKFGKVYENKNGKTELVAFNEIEGQYEFVQIISQMMIITQYDLLWREDIFDGWDFYNSSHCIEFQNAGYKVAVPFQQEPWVIHDCKEYTFSTKFNFYKEKFLEEYSKDIFPLVSVLIPTYNRPEFFQLALESVLKQTYKNIEILIGDDSTNDDTETIINENYLIRYPQIKYYRNKTNLGQFENDLALFNRANGDFINFLMDDDLFKPNKIENMMNYFLQDKEEEIALVTSHRAIIDKNGNIQGIFGGTDKFFTEDTIIQGIDLGNFVLKNNYNCVGEPTTVLFKKNKLIEPFGTFNERKYGCNVDQASWLNLLSKGKAVFIAESLSYFRIHNSQQLNTEKMVLLGAIDYAHEVLTSSRKGFLLDENDLNKAIDCCLAYCEKVLEMNNRVENLDLMKWCEELIAYSSKLKDLKESLDRTESLSRVKIPSSEQPLVSILIPAYNQTNYLKEALESALNQTYSNIEIVIGDDSSNNVVENFIKPYLDKYNNITYFKNPDKTSDHAYYNHANCLKHSKGEYINYLNHDDLFKSEKIERMMSYFNKYPELSLVTSARQPIDQYGRNLPLTGAFAGFFNKDTVVEGYELSRIIINNLVNIIGEPTTVLFKRKYIVEDKLNYFNGVRYKNIGDVANWFTLLLQGDAVYISEPLSCFRIHPSQSSNKQDVYANGIIFWFQLIKDSYRVGIIQNRQEYRSTIINWLNTFTPAVKSLTEYNLDNLLLNNVVLSYKEAIDEVFSNGEGVY